MYTIKNTELGPKEFVAFYAKQFSGLTLVEKVIFTEYQEMQSQTVLCFVLKFLGFQERKEKDVVLFCYNSMALLDLPSEETQPVNKFLQF